MPEHFHESLTDILIRAYGVFTSAKRTFLLAGVSLGYYGHCPFVVFFVYDYAYSPVVRDRIRKKRTHVFIYDFGGDAFPFGLLSHWPEMVRRPR